MLTNIPRLISAYYLNRPDPAEPSQQVSFGTSGHRGNSLLYTFNEAHILAIVQAICCYRKLQGINGPLFLGFDTHALSEPAFYSTIEVLAANNVSTYIAAKMEYTPTPVISHAILSYNRNRNQGLADGIIITPSHNPPDNGGIKYNPPNGGPADTTITAWIAATANQFLHNNSAIQRLPYNRAKTSGFVHDYDFLTAYVTDLKNCLDLAAISAAGLHIGADALGGSGLAYWGEIATHYRLNLEVIHAEPDPTFRFMPLDSDGKIRMDCSSPYAMAGLINQSSRYDLAVANDPDFDRHGIVTRSAGLLNPNHYLTAAIYYLFQHRPAWPATAAVGKTMVSSAIIDRVAASLRRPLFEVPVGFKWFVDGLFTGSLGFAGEESAGASFLRQDGSVWTTDKDGIILALLAAEIMAKTGRDPAELYQALTADFGAPLYSRSDIAADANERAQLKAVTAEQITTTTLAADPITAILTTAPTTTAALDGIKVCSANGWFAARPSGTEAVYKIYAESFVGHDHLRQIQSEAQTMLAKVFHPTNAG